MSFTEAYRSLQTAQKGRARGAPAYSVFINRPVGRILAAAAHQRGLTPNQVSIISGVFTFAGIIALAVIPPSGALGVAVWLLLAIGYAWDSADGQVARLRGGGSVAGEWLDHVLDSAKLVSLHLAVAIGAFRYFDLPRLSWLLVPLGFAVVSTVTFFAMILNDLLSGKSGAPPAADAGGASTLRSLAGLPTDYGVWCFAFAFWGWQEGFSVIYLALAIAAGLYLIAALPVWFRRMRRLPPASA